MDAALLLAALASRAGDRVDLLADDRQVRARVARAGPRDAAGALPDAMAALEPALVETDWPRLAGRSLASAGSARSSCCSPRSSPRPSRRACSRRCRPLPDAPPGGARLGARPGARPAGGRGAARAEVYDAAAAERRSPPRHRTAELLAALGVDVVDADADDLPPALADPYLALKAAGRSELGPGTVSACGGDRSSSRSAVDVARSSARVERPAPRGPQPSEDVGEEGELGDHADARSGPRSAAPTASRTPRSRR